MLFFYLCHVPITGAIAGFLFLHRGQFQGCMFLQKGPKQVETLWLNIPRLF